MKHRKDPVRLRPLRVVWFVVSSTLTVLALVAAVGLLPSPSVAEAGAEHNPAGDSQGWRPWQSLVDLA